MLIFYNEELLAPCPTPKLEDQPAGCLQLLIQYIRSYPPYLEAVSSIHNLRTHCAMVTRDPPNMVYDNGYQRLSKFKFYFISRLSGFI
jgi:hypothetical protein